MKNNVIPMKKLYAGIFASLVIALVLFSLPALASPQGNRDDDASRFSARMTGFGNVPTLYSTGVGSFVATLSADGSELTYTLTFSGLTGAMMSHIHLGLEGTNGGVIVWLCGGGGKPVCPATGGTVSGTITAKDVQGPASQGISAGSFAALLASLRAGAAYVNVHTLAFPAGEIRGQIEAD